MKTFIDNLPETDVIGTWQDQAIDYIKSFKGFGYTWNVKERITIINNCCRFIKNKTSGLPIPSSIDSILGGNIKIEWSMKGVYIALEFTVKGKIKYVIEKEYDSEVGNKLIQTIIGK